MSSAKLTAEDVVSRLRQLEKYERNPEHELFYEEALALLERYTAQVRSEAREQLESIRLRAGYIQHMCGGISPEARLEAEEIERIAICALAQALETKGGE